MKRHEHWLYGICDLDRTKEIAQLMGLKWGYVKDFWYQRDLFPAQFFYTFASFVGFDPEELIEKWNSSPRVIEKQFLVIKKLKVPAVHKETFTRKDPIVYRRMLGKPTKEETEEAVKKFLERGGKVRVLPPQLACELHGLGRLLNDLTLED